MSTSGHALIAKQYYKQVEFVAKRHIQFRVLLYVGLLAIVTALKIFLGIFGVLISRVVENNSDKSDLDLLMKKINFVL
jgi:hypothetical protein